MNLGSVWRCFVVFLSGTLGLGFGENSGVAQPVTTDGLMLWLRADQPGELDDAGHVATWKNHAPASDQHAYQSHPDWRPRWIESVGSLGGQPALEFDGVDDFLHLPWLRIGAETTVILVAENSAQTDGGSYWRAVLSGDDDSFRDEATKYAFSFRRAEYDPLFIANLYYAPGRAHRLTQPAGTRVRTDFFLYTFRRHGSLPEGTSLRVDGATVGALTAEPEPAGFPGTGYTIGQGGDVHANRRFRFYRGRIAEILIYDRALPKVQLWPVEAYLADKYRLPRAYTPPTDGLSLWLNADSLPTPDGEAGIGHWPDDSSHGHDGSQADPALRPQYVARGINRRPALDFRDGFARLDFGGWVPPADGTAYAALRRVPHERARIKQVCPAIDAEWTGTDGPFRGRLGELLVYDRRLSPEEAYQVRQYLDYRYSESPDPRWFDNGTLIFHNGYNDQPYLVRCHDGSWLCVITTSRISEQGADRTLVVTRSRDQGQTWSEPVESIESPELRQPSWATLYVTPYGRVYVFYNLRERADGPSPIGFFFKYSDDHGATWSDQRYRIPIRKIAIDHQMPGIGGWSVSPPVALGPDVLVSYTRYGSHGKRSQGQGFVFRSDNLQTERDPARIRWEMYPAGDWGIRAPDVDSDMQEEHIITPLAGDDLLCIWRTTSGFACQSYSRDGGRTWTQRGYATYEPGGRRIKQPLACCRPYRTADGRYLLWFHNTRSQGGTAIYRPRDVVWLAGGHLQDGMVHWSQPEVLLYGFDLPVRGLGMSYPDFIEQDGRLWITTTDKEDARIFEIDPTLLAGLWDQQQRSSVPVEGLAFDVNDATILRDGSLELGVLPSLLHGGLTIDLAFRLDRVQPGQVLLECRSDSGRGWTVTTGENQTLQMELRIGKEITVRCPLSLGGRGKGEGEEDPTVISLPIPSDGRHPSEHWTTDTGLLSAGRRHQVTWIIDGGPNLILPVVDGVLCDGGEAARGWGRFSRRLTDVTDDRSKLRIAPQLEGQIEHLRIYRRPLRVTEAIGIHRHDRSRSRAPNETP